MILRWTALTLLLALGTPAWAGTVILENGEVIIGKIKPEDADEENVIVRWPYKDFVPPEGSHSIACLSPPSTSSSDARGRISWSSVSRAGCSWGRAG